MSEKGPRAYIWVLTLVALLLLGSTVGQADSLAAKAPRSPAQAPAAPNESVVTARITDAIIVDSTMLGMAPSQRLCMLILRVLSVKASSDVPAIRPTDKTVRAYTKDVDLTRLKGTTVTVTLTRRSGERQESLWLVRVEDLKETR